MLTEFYQKKKDFQKRLVRDIKIFLKKKKKRNVSMVVNHIKIFQRMKKQRLVIVCARLRQVTPFPSTFVPSNFHLMLYNVSYG